MPSTSTGSLTPTQAIVRKRTKSTTNSHNREEGEDGNKTASFFSKNRVARRVKTNEDNRGRARKDREREREREREHEVEFEIHSASGVSSGDNSPNDRDGVRKIKKVDEEEKWMGTSNPSGRYWADARYPHRKRRKADGSTRCSTTSKSQTTTTLPSRRLTTLTEPRKPKPPTTAHRPTYSRIVLR
jgi:hypothetical protein